MPLLEPSRQSYTHSATSSTPFLTPVTFRPPPLRNKIGTARTRTFFSFVGAAVPLNTADDQFISRSSRYRLTGAAFKGRARSQPTIAAHYAVHVARVHQRGRFTGPSRAHTRAKSVCSRQGSLAPFSRPVITYRRFVPAYRIHRAPDYRPPSAVGRAAQLQGTAQTADHVPVSSGKPSSNHVIPRHAKIPSGRNNSECRSSHWFREVTLPRAVLRRA